MDQEATAILAAATDQLVAAATDHFASHHRGVSIPSVSVSVSGITNICETCRQLMNVWLQKDGANFVRIIHVGPATPENLVLVFDLSV